MIRYLNPDERQDIRQLYEEVFQDSKAFVDYYFETYVKQHTRCLVYEQDGHICGMISIHEKQWCYRKFDGTYDLRPAWYIYGVATVPNMRKQGIMGKLLARIIEDATAEQIPYIYLIPVNPAIYEKHGFRLVSGMEGAGKAMTILFDLPNLDIKNTSENGLTKLAENYRRYYEEQNVDAFLYKDVDYFRDYITQLSLDGNSEFALYAHPVMIYDNKYGMKIETLGPMDEV